MKVNGLPGSFRERNGRWSWRVILPGQADRQEIRLVPIGATMATKDFAVAVEIARDIYQRSILDAHGASSCKNIADMCQVYIAEEVPFYSKSEASNLKMVARRLTLQFGTMTPADFSPLHLKAFRNEIIRQGRIDGKLLARSTVNKYTNLVKRMFAWAVSEGHAPAIVHHGLTAVSGIRKGRSSDVRETEEVGPVANVDIERTQEFCPRVIRDMIEIQNLTAMRSGELVIMRPCDIDRTGDVWTYTPTTHKTAHRGHERIIAIGPKAQAVLNHYLSRNTTDFCFSPKAAMAQRLAKRHESRKIKVGYGNNPKRQDEWMLELGDYYDTRSYRRAVKFAITKGLKEKGSDYIKQWTPHQLRHAAATRIREAMGIEAASAVLGHSDIETTKIYAQRRKGMASEAARKMG